MYLLGIDIGTSGTKTVLFDENGRAVRSYTGEYPLYQPQNGWAEQDPVDWWSAAADGIRSVLAGLTLSAGDIAVGLSGQMHGLVMLDAAGNVLRPSIIWCDQRTGAEAEEINRVFGAQRLIEVTANPAMTGFTLAKILWVQKHEPELYARCAHILLPKDYIRYRLTGEFATEVSDASGMQLMDIAARNWSAEVLSAFRIDRSLLGDMLESAQPAGKITAEASALTGLPVGAVVAAGAGDNPAAAIGTGIVAEGSAFNTVGTSAVIYAVTDKPCIDKQGRIHTMCASVPGKWTLMSCTQSAGLSLRWLRDVCCRDICQEAEQLGTDPYILMDRLAEAVPPGADKLLYLPYLMGERSPHPDPDCRGVFFGLSARHTQGNLIRAVMEGVAYSQKECLDVFAELGIRPETVTCCGGGAKSPLWRRIMADVYGCGITSLKEDQGGALGAALLAGVAAGVFDNVAQACACAVSYGKTVQPSPEAAAYGAFYSQYKALYTALKPSFQQLAKL